jgi:hypothetical protein
MAELLLDLAGFVVRSRLVREPAAGERTAQEYLFGAEAVGDRPGRNGPCRARLSPPRAQRS